MLAIVFVVVALAAQCSALVRSDMFAYGSDYQNPADGLSNQLTVNVTGQFDQAALLDSYAAITIPVTYPNFRIFGADLGKNVFVSIYAYIHIIVHKWKHLLFACERCSRNIFREVLEM